MRSKLRLIIIKYLDPTHSCKTSDHICGDWIEFRACIFDSYLIRIIGYTWDSAKYIPDFRKLSSHYAQLYLLVVNQQSSVQIKLCSSTLQAIILQNSREYTNVSV